MKKLFFFTVILLCMSCTSIAMQKDHFEKRAQERSHQKMLRTSGGVQEVLAEIEHITDFPVNPPPRSRSASPQIHYPSKLPPDNKNK